ncbi:MAG: hypothetical protein JJT96_07265 [Opitutales bacterium]|nr:hypothetical protein [Opitutales bacterium]
MTDSSKHKENLKKDALAAQRQFDQLPEEKKAALREKKEAEHFDTKKARKATERS